MFIKNYKSFNEELFNGYKTEYNIKEILLQSPDPEILAKNDYLITFKTSSNTEYRIDLKSEINTNTYHISFSLKNRNSYGYSDLNVIDSDSKNILNFPASYNDSTNKNESIEVFNKLIWILKDISQKLNIHKFCIGGAEEKRNNIYKYIIKSASKFEYKIAQMYPKLWALYFEI